VGVAWARKDHRWTESDTPNMSSLMLDGCFSGRLFGLLYWWIGTTWYRLTTAASLLDVFVLTR
jgi:hypothetical protein